MKINKKLIVFLTISFLSLAVVFAGGKKRAGTSAAPELLIPVGSQYLAMGGAAVANAVGMESMYYNPAGLDRMSTTGEAVFSHRQYIADMSVNFFAIGAKTSFGTVALSLRNLDIGDIPITTNSATDGTGEVFSPAFFVLGVSYSKLLSDRISVGLNINLVSESFDRVEASGVAFDAGVQYSDIFAVEGLKLGVVVKNLGGSMSYDGTGTWTVAEDPKSDRGQTSFQYGTASAEFPSLISIGMSYDYMIDESNLVTVAGSFSNNNYQFDEIRLGAEYSYQDMFYVRAGYVMSPQATDDVPNIFENLTAGLGFNVNSVIEGFNATIDYAYVPVEYFDDNHVVSLKVGF